MLTVDTKLATLHKKNTFTKKRSKKEYINEQRKAVMKEKWTHSSITQHIKTYKANVDWKYSSVPL